MPDPPAAESDREEKRCCRDHHDRAEHLHPTVEDRVEGVGRRHLLRLAERAVPHERLDRQRGDEHQ
jgi:hypothetical protein